MKYACITMDIEQDIHSKDFEIELFSNKEKLRSFKEVIQKHDAKSHGFIVTKFIEKNPSLVETIASDLPFILDVHSHNHIQKIADTESEIDLSMEWYSKFFNRSPKGYRAPNGLMSNDGIKRLMERGFLFDSSIFPANRYDEYGYKNRHLPVDPFIYQQGDRELTEMPFAVIPRVRLVFSISFIKLFGLGFYKSLIKLFGLPQCIVIDTHPYDFTISKQLPLIKGWKRMAHARNADNAFNLLDELLEMLAEMDYTFVDLNEAISQISRDEMERVQL